ncbi:helix-turn-helix domain-containing protein [Steroidobacter flavus]|uniref:Helix-turn-helix domain-containing protein n=1 Tax=Steroidobacter flavus TaxID=1842136 RepID=A0ABV8SXJ7_9GAMM
MRVNAELILRMRKDKAWSQEELAIAAGLNLRTIQRIEKEATASLQSMKALASAFAVNIRDLEQEESAMLSELVGKEVWIVMGITVIDPRFNDSLKGKIVEINDSWLKLVQKDKSIYINLSQIKRIVPE